MPVSSSDGRPAWPRYVPVAAPEPTPDRLRRLRWLMAEWMRRGWVVSAIAADDVAISMANRWPSLFAGRATVYHDEVVYEPAAWVVELANAVLTRSRVRL